jgi:hypothetical protein
VAVTGQDWSRLGADVEHLAVFSSNRAFMRMVDGHCAALIVRCEGAGGRDYFCSVYERRPQICRELERGSPECGGERATKAQDVVRYQPADFPFIESIPSE